MGKFDDARELDVPFGLLFVNHCVVDAFVAGACAGVLLFGISLVDDETAFRWVDMPWSRTVDRHPKISDGARNLGVELMLARPRKGE